MPSRNSIQPIWRRTFAADMLTGLQTLPADPILETPSVRLLTGSPSITPDTALADLTAAIATFSGYASVSPTPPGPVVNPSANSVALYLPALFLATVVDPFVANIVTGYYVVQGTDWAVAEVWDSELFVPIASPGDFVDLAVLIGLQFLQSL